ncbi:acyltransferase 3 [Favolaschia claudopus]|uniref:Acyltransferase 3 n=1 Tax=Favolaschia claudopus TaxID=2862362 RepID=A0AAW0DZJ1_9AGAR
MSDNPESELAALLPRLIRDARVHFIDNLRSTLVALVIFHHAALPFGGIGFWPYISPHHPPQSSITLSIFVAVNQSYFMGMLFALSGHFSALSASRKSWAAFCSDKLKRLGIPIVVSTLLIFPLGLAIVWWANQTPIQPALISYYRNLNGARGPVWYLAVLLCFDLVYITVRKFFPPFSFLVPRSVARYRVTVVVCLATVIIGSYLIRLPYPVGRVLPPLGLQLAYALQYVLAYIAGTCLTTIEPYFLVKSNPGRVLVLSYVLAVLSLVAISIPLQYGHKWLFDMLYACWNELCFYFLGTALYSFFHASSHTTKRWGNTARYSYGAYIIHALVIVLLQILADNTIGPGLVFGGVIKTLVVGAVGVVLSWAAAWVLIRIPEVGRII